MKKAVRTNIFSLSAFFILKMMNPEGNQFLTSKWLHSSPSKVFELCFSFRRTKNGLHQIQQLPVLPCKTGAWTKNKLKGINQI